LDVKVPSSPYKRGSEGTCKGVHNFDEYRLSEILCLLVLELFHVFVREFLPVVLGGHLIFRLLNIVLASQEIFFIKI
jgi:hypothetical protein